MENILIDVVLKFEVKWMSGWMLHKKLNKIDESKVQDEMRKCGKKVKKAKKEKYI